MKYKDKHIIGITGGIGTGKTTVLEMFKTEFDAEVIEADHIGHVITEPGASAYRPVVDAFGETILNHTDMTIDRKRLGDIVFSDKEKLKLLNSITHPFIQQEIEKIISMSTKKLLILEAAILTETTLKDICDEIWYIYSDESIRIERLAKYRGMSEEKARSIIANQPLDNEFRKCCHVEINNSGDRENTLMQIKENIPGGKLWEK